jgi:hypothetical protein
VAAAPGVVHDGRHPAHLRFLPLAGPFATIRPLMGDRPDSATPTLAARALSGYAYVYAFAWRFS